MKRVIILAALLPLVFLFSACSVIDDYAGGEYERLSYDMRPDTEVQNNSNDTETNTPFEEVKPDKAATQPRGETASSKTDTENKSDKESKAPEVSDNKSSGEDKKSNENGKSDDGKDNASEEKTSSKDDNIDLIGETKLKELNRGEPTEYKGLDNKAVGWWYKAGKVGGRASIDMGVQKLLDKYGAIWQLPAGTKKMYLTFDEGYEYKENTTAILDVLKEKKVPACFFITGHFLKSRPDLVQRMVNEGHVVASHTVNHYNQPKALNEGKLLDDILELERLYTEATGEELSRFLRPPEGAYSEATLSFITELGYRPVFWSFAYKDWLTDAQPDREEAFKKISSQFHDGSIILLHAVSETNASVLGNIIDEAISRGYSFASFEELK